VYENKNRIAYNTYASSTAAAVPLNISINAAEITQCSFMLVQILVLICARNNTKSFLSNSLV